MANFISHPYSRYGVAAETGAANAIHENDWLAIRNYAAPCHEVFHDLNGIRLTANVAYWRKAGRLEWHTTLGQEHGSDQLRHSETWKGYEFHLKHPVLKSARIGT